MLLTTKEFKEYLIPIIILPIVVGVIGNLIGNIFSVGWGEYGALFGVSLFIGVMLYFIIMMMFDIEKPIIIALPILLLIIIGILYIIAPGISNIIFTLWMIIKDIFSNGWAIWVILLIAFGLFALKKNS